MVSFPFAHIARRVSVVFARLFLPALASLCLSLPASADPSSVWFSSSGNLFLINADLNTVVQTLPVNAIAQLAVDSQGVVWTVTEKQLSKRGKDGVTQFQADFKTLGLQSAPTIAVDPYDNSLWLVDHNTILHLANNGQPLNSIATPFADIRQIQVTPDQSLWILGNKQLARYSALGILTASFDIHAVTSAEPQYFVVDELGGSIWLAGGKELIQTDIATAKLVLHSVMLGETALDLVLQPKTGAVWVLSKDNLTSYDMTGTLVRNIDLKGQVITGVDTSVFDPVANSMWVTYQAGVARFSVTGDVLAKIATQKSAEEIAAVPFKLLPQVSLLSPVNGLLTNNPKPNFGLQFDVSCNGQPCGFTTTDLGGYSLNALLNGQAVGNLFAFDIASGKTAFTPASRLPEGINNFTAQARDMFGHLSNTVTSNFTIDTVPPKFLALIPTEGSVFFTPQVIVSGGVDEPGQVLMENLTDFLGSSTNPASVNFSFGLTLNPGLNSIRLRASDLAGNVANKTLNLTYAPEIKISLDSPADGAVVNGNSTILSGTFQGPPNLGITVNGIVAAIDGNHFYANVPLQAGSNSITVVGSAPELASVTKTLAVTGSVSAFQVSVFPQNGIAPHPVNFSVFSGTSNGIARIDLDFDGDGITDFTTTDPNATIQTTYTTPGVYQPRVTVTDSQGATYISTLVVVVTTVGKIDAVLRSVYGGMLAKLRAGDVDGALKAFTPGVVEQYRQVFEDLRPNLATITGQLGTIVDGSIMGGLAEYVVVQDTPNGKQAFLLYFLKGSDGTWLIGQM